MGYFNEFPHTRIYDGDLGWLIKIYKELVTLYKSNNEYLQGLIDDIEQITLDQLQEWLEDGTIGGDLLDKLVYNHSYIYPESYGAVGDGVTDDTQAFIQAFNKLDEDTSYVLYLSPNKNYLVRQAFTLKSNYKIQGTFTNNEYRDSSILTTENANTFTLSEDVTNVSIDGVCFVNNGNWFLNTSYVLRYLSSITNCGFYGFNYVFSQSFLSSMLQNLSIQNSNGIGTLKGSDNYIDHLYCSGSTTNTYDALMYSQLSNSYINFLYLTGVINGSTGVNNLIVIQSGRGNTWQNLYLDYPLNDCLLIKNDLDTTRVQVFRNIFCRGFGGYAIEFMGTSRNFIIDGLILTASHIPDVRPDNPNLIRIPTTTYFTQLSNITSQIANYVVDNQSGTSYILDNYNHINTFYTNYQINNLAVSSSDISLADKQISQFDFNIGDINNVKLESSATIYCDIMNGNTKLNLHVIVTSIRDYHLRGIIINASGGSVAVPKTARYNFTIYGIRNDNLAV